MSDIPFATNLLPSYQTPQAMMQAAANTASTQAGTQNTNAQTGLLGAQTQGADIANQSSQLSLNALQQAMSGSGAPGPTATSGAAPAPVGGTNVDPNDVTTGVQAKFAPLPTARPPAVLNQMYAFSRAGKPEIAAAIGAQYDAQVQGANQQRSLGANSTYQMAQQVASAPPGAALDTLSRYDPNAAAAFKASHSSDDPDQLDADARLLAQHTGIAVHQYTGRDTDFQNGVLVDKKDGKPVLGSEQVLTGLNAEGKEKAFNAANELVDFKNSNGTESQVPRWQAAGKPSAEAYVISADKAARSSATTANGASNGPSAPPGNTSATVAPPQQNSAPAGPAAITTDPTLKAMLTDPDYKLKTSPVVRGTSATPAELDQQKATVQSRTDLLKDSGDATQAASQSLQYLNAAKQIMDSKGAAPTTGMFGPIRAEISRVYGGVDATNYAEVAKYLGNAALANAKGIYGPRMSTSEVELQLNDLSPSTKMTPDAINNLINNNIKSAQYTIDTAKRARSYVASGGDPQSFSQANQQYYPREKIVGAAPPVERPGQGASGAVQTATGPNGQKLFLRNGQWAPQ